MNIRIDERLKTLGDNAFATIGWTPSQATRALWSFAVKHQKDPKMLKRECEKLAGKDASEGESPQSKVETGWNLVDQGLARCGLDSQGLTPLESYDDLRERIVHERLSERGVL